MTETICSSRLANIFSVRLHKFAKESLAGDSGGVLKGAGGLLTVFNCFVEGILGNICKLTTIWVLLMQEIKKCYFYHQGLTGCEWICLAKSLLCFGLCPYTAIMNMEKVK